MSDDAPAALEGSDALLRRLQEAHQALMGAIAQAAPDHFDRKNEDGNSAKRILERSADDVNFYYGRLVAQAVSLPQPPGVRTADFGSLEEAKASIQAAHRRLSRLLHDITTADLDRKTRLENTAEHTLRQVLETAVAHYRLRRDQLERLHDRE